MTISIAAMNPYSATSGANPMRLYTSLAVFLLGAIALIVPSGYSLGAAMLLLGSVVLVWRRDTLTIERRDLIITGVMAAFALAWMLDAWLSGLGSRGFDKPSRFLLAIPAMLLVLAYPPRLAMLWAGLAIGAIAAGGWAGWQKLVEGVGRASGFTFVIQFGNISMLMGILCLAGLGWAAVQPRARVWMSFLLIGATGGIMGSLFSGSRGGWVGFPIVLLVLYRAYGKEVALTWRLVTLGLVLAGAVLVYALPQTGVKERVDQAVSDVSRYVSGESRVTSVGARFEMWKGAAHLIAERPVMGWGERGYQQGMAELGDQGVIDQGVLIYDHAHNEFVEVTAKRGFIGLLTLLALYLVPMKLFARQLQAYNLEVRALAVAGVLLSVAYIDFGLSQVLLQHNSGVMIFAFWLAVLWGSFRQALDRESMH